jgi:hypothetical protein
MIVHENRKICTVAGVLIVTFIRGLAVYARMLIVLVFTYYWKSYMFATISQVLSYAISTTYNRAIRVIQGY